MYGSIVCRFYYWLEASPKGSSLERFLRYQKKKKKKMYGPKLPFTKWGPTYENFFFFLFFNFLNGGKVEIEFDLKTTCFDTIVNNHLSQSSSC
jgi:hypothetical protein